ncbi:hypothetical protein CLI64_08185 [Nostoc sp. CENA543]|uniref:hypothetical protein n=1 Tax=Nostoc sp. CENA543 TaxID=1869241 RepID=UPI000CA3D3A0|nr:hypothetical protein [Nostoc sp. CENA543]AUT00366.1 hypothetical protein CLI64_08185 [Nostoc sp. CENA543]
MFFGQIEREMLSAEIYSLWQNQQLSDNLNLHANQELGKQDIWELHTPDSQVTPESQKKLTIAKRNSGVGF